MKLSKAEIYKLDSEEAITSAKPMRALLIGIQHSDDVLTIDTRVKLFRFYDFVTNACYDVPERLVRKFSGRNCIINAHIIHTRAGMRATMTDGGDFYNLPLLSPAGNCTRANYFVVDFSYEKTPFIITADGYYAFVKAKKLSSYRSGNENMFYNY